MTSEGLGKMFEGDSADTCSRKFPLMLMGGASGGSSVRRPGSEDPHRHERKLIKTIGLQGSRKLRPPDSYKHMLVGQNKKLSNN